MNRNDIQLITVLTVFLAICLIIINCNKKEGNIFKVYYENDLILKGNLNIDKIYQVNGYNGIVKIEVKNKKIRVITENSPLHLCSKQGFISKSYETIVCLPNKIVIKIENDKNLDGVVG